MRSGRVLLVLAVALLFAACSSKAPSLTPPMLRDVYIWQRVWTLETAVSLEQLGNDVQGVRMLWTQLRGDIPQFSMHIHSNHAVLAGKHVVPVIRIEGSDTRTSPGRAVEHAVQAIEELTELGANVSLVEIDHDSATSKLEDYAVWLAQVRKLLPPGFRLGITALPAWRDAPGLSLIMAEVDQVTVQVHAPDRLSGPLFAPEDAKQAVRAYARQRPNDVTLWVSLPTYRVSVDARLLDPLPDRSLANPSNGVDAGRVELVASPDELADFVRWLEHGKAMGVNGIVWFRLPQPTDRDTFRMPTLRALLRGEPLSTKLRVETQATDVFGLGRDVYLINDGPHDLVYRAAMTWPSDCGVGEAAPHWHLGNQSFVPDSPFGVLLRVGELHRVGWMRCATSSSNTAPSQR